MAPGLLDALITVVELLHAGEVLDAVSEGGKSGEALSVLAVRDLAHVFTTLEEEEVGKTDLVTTDELV